MWMAAMSVSEVQGGKQQSGGGSGQALAGDQVETAAMVPLDIDRLRWPDWPCCRCTRCSLGLRLADALRMIR